MLDDGHAGECDGPAYRYGPELPAPDEMLKRRQRSARDELQAGLARKKDGVAK